MTRDIQGAFTNAEQAITHLLDSHKEYIIYAGTPPADSRRRSYAKLREEILAALQKLQGQVLNTETWS